MLQHWYMCTLLVSGFNSTSICNGFTLAAQWTWTGGPWKIPVSFVYVATMFFRKGKVSFSYVITKKKIMFTLLVANKAMCLFQRRKDTNQNQSMLFIATKKEDIERGYFNTINRGSTHDESPMRKQLLRKIWNMWTWNFGVFYGFLLETETRIKYDVVQKFVTNFMYCRSYL